MRTLTRRLAMAALLLVAGSGAAVAGDITGLWQTDDGEAVIAIAPCGNLLCGRIVSLKSPIDDDGQPMQDDHNPDQSLRERPLCGLEVIAGLKPHGSRFDGGTIYDPENGSRYGLVIAPTGEATIAVTGFVGIEALGETHQWHRAPATVVRCDAPASPPAGAKPAAGRKS